jgi:hypothetical protein
MKTKKLMSKKEIWARLKKGNAHNSFSLFGSIDDYTHKELNVLFAFSNMEKLFQSRLSIRIKKDSGNWYLGMLTFYLESTSFEDILFEIIMYNHYKQIIRSSFDQIHELGDYRDLSFLTKKESIDYLQHLN